mgnify:CR=1 FL=1
MKPYKMLIDGAWVEARDGGTFTSINPATGEEWAEIPEATAEDVDCAVRAADRAFREGPWAQMNATQRGHCLRRLADLLAAQSETLGEIETRDTGKLFAETRWQAKYISEFYHFFAGAADKIHGETVPIDKPDMFVFTNREPLGVIAAVVPWNSQLFLAAVKIGPALAAGNTVVMKASEHAPAALLEFGNLIAQAGIPDGVVNIVTGHGDPCGKVLTSHPMVARVSFTGGPGSARHVIQNTTENFAELSLELGGKSPFIVFEDADIESAVNGSVAGIFGASGQSCVAGSRLLVHEDIADEFLKRMVKIAQAVTIGDPMAGETEMGPLCTYGQLENIEREVARAVEETACVHEHEVGALIVGRDLVALGAQAGQDAFAIDQRFGAAEGDHADGGLAVTLGLAKAGGWGEVGAEGRWVLCHESGYRGNGGRGETVCVLLGDWFDGLE